MRRHTDLPFVMDETVNDVGSLLDCHRESAADVVNIKISKFGGLTKAKQERDSTKIQNPKFLACFETLITSIQNLKLK